MEYRDKKPIYIQIVEDILMDLTKGNLTPGDKFPTIKEMSLKYHVNPNTIQKVIKELETMDLIQSKRGLGVFLVDDEAITNRIKTQFIENRVQEFIEDMKNMGISRTEIITILRKEGER